MAGTDILLYSVGGLLLGLYLFYRGFHHFRRKQLMENTPRSKIRSIAMGLVEVYGKVVPFKKILKSPFTGTSCVYYKYLIQEYRHSGKRSYWANISKDDDCVPFLLTDDTGAVLVDPKNAEIDIPQKYMNTASSVIDFTEDTVNFLKKNKISYKGFLGFNKRLKFQEWYIYSPPLKRVKKDFGDRLYIMGSAGDNPHVEEGSSQMGYEDVMISKGRGDKPFFISNKSEKKILSNLGFKTYGYLIGGPILSIICLFILLGFLNLI